MPIQLLPPQLANQIAAGEVVERPASVVKELVENSLDSGATKIEVDILHGGHKQILIRDNGNGIAKDELRLALSRHATSKIASLEDLEAIMSMGFRGEALASISSVSRLTLTSKTSEQNEAWQASAEGMDMAVDIVPAAHPTGTTVNVQDLFFNTPARRRFLRTEKTEFTHIENVFKRIAMANPAIEFLLHHNGKRIKHCRITDSVKNRVTSLVNGVKNDSLTAFQGRTEGVEVSGYVLDAEYANPSLEMQYSFVNQRPMRDKLLNHAIRQAYELLGINTDKLYYVLFVSVPPDSVDVNVHPAKHEVRFHQSRLVHDFVSSTVRAAVESAYKDAGWAEPTALVTDSQSSHNYIQPPRPVSSAANSTSMPSSSSHRPAGLSARPFASAGHQVQSGATQWVGSTVSEPQTQRLFEINSRYSLCSHSEQIWCIDWQSLLVPRLQTELARVERSQPLLLPVAVGVTANWSEHLRQALEAQHIIVEKRAAKLILKQVPAGWRHMPWSNGFSEFIQTCDADDVGSSLINSLLPFLSADCEQQYQLNQQWFLLLEHQQKKAVLEQYSKALTENEVVERLFMDTSS